MEKRVIIGFGHKLQRGKGEAARFANEWLCRNIRTRQVLGLDFAEPLKFGIGREIFKLYGIQLYGREKAVVDAYWGLTPREILQRAGDAMRNAFGQDVFARAFTRNVMARDEHVVCSDVRFVEEAEAIKSLGGYVVCIDREEKSVDPGPLSTHPAPVRERVHENSEDVHTWNADLHKSELALDNYTGWDAVIENNGTIADLKSKVTNLLLHITRT